MKVTNYILILHPVTLDDRFVSCESRNFAAFETPVSLEGGLWTHVKFNLTNSNKGYI